MNNDMIEILDQAPKKDVIQQSLCKNLNCRLYENSSISDASEKPQREQNYAINYNLNYAMMVHKTRV